MSRRCDCETCRWLSDNAAEMGIAEALDGYVSVCDLCPEDCSPPTSRMTADLP